MTDVSEVHRPGSRRSGGNSSGRLSHETFESPKAGLLDKVGFSRRTSFSANSIRKIRLPCRTCFRVPVLSRPGKVFTTHRYRSSDPLTPVPSRNHKTYGRGVKSGVEQNQKGSGTGPGEGPRR